MLKTGLNRYQKSISILKKGYEQEKFRISQLCKSDLGEMKVRDIKSHHIADYRDNRLQQTNIKTGKPISSSTVRLEMSLLSNFFEIGRIEWGIVNENPVKNVRKPKPTPGRTRRLSPREESLIVRYCNNYKNEELYCIIILALETAMRQGEILSLRWEHINLQKRIAHLPTTKNGSTRDIPLSVKAKDILLSLDVNTTGKVFSYSSAGFKTTWRVMVKKLNIEDLKFHDLRHEAVSRLFEKSTLDMMEVAAISGHKSLSMLKRYTHLKAQKLVKKLDGNKNKGRQFILDHLNPYPVFIKNDDQLFKITIPDFKVCTFGETKTASVSNSKEIILRKTIELIKNNEKIPHPDHFLGYYDGERILISPV
ncbi:MAG: site-specific integrase [Hydrogenovibrio crunogenus]|nr:site-specific integrase [Hydrogenovibrio crunogenus]